MLELEPDGNGRINRCRFVLPTTYPWELNARIADSAVPADADSIWTVDCVLGRFYLALWRDMKIGMGHGVDAYFDRPCLVRTFRERLSVCSIRTPATSISA